ncbi:MAG: ECF transporter S component [Oscillospiraceae bacterium]|nr:ECF transporter S component [Oscillospiraceae bacterium]
MKNTFTLSKTDVKTKSLATFIAVICAVILPQIFHYAGIVSGTGALSGASFLPMQIPVLVAGFLAGPVVGLLAGVISPLVSFGISGMPALVLLPFMTLELAGMGLVAGLLHKSKTPLLPSLIIAQSAGRILRVLAVVIAVSIFNSETVTIGSTWTAFRLGLPGILLQWALIPLIIYRVRGASVKGEKRD